jgi:5,5'-dehydrodivanillate O-demethylase
MLSKEENERLTRVGPGTPGGNLLRRYWQPIAGTAELTAERPKKRVKILGEELVLYRDGQGGYGLVAEHCAHRGTSLYYGFLEDGCLRCAYHGWLYDRDGRCLEQPFEPPGSTYKDRIRQLAYPVEELGGLLFTYLGPPERKPLLPRWDFLVIDEQRRITLQPLACNWVQAQENSADVTHTFFLHGQTMVNKGREQFSRHYTRPLAQYGFQPFEWGLLKSWEYTGEHASSGWGNLLVFPNILRIIGAMHWRVPVDDTHTTIVMARARGMAHVEPDDPSLEAPVDPPEVWRKPDGDYHLDSFPCQDGMAWETEGPLFDRSQEHLGASDRGIVLFRKLLSEQIAIVEHGGDPMALVYDPAKNEVIDLESWENESDMHWSASQATDDPNIRPREAVFDERHEVFTVPFGSARPAPKAGMEP